VTVQVIAIADGEGGEERIASAPVRLNLPPAR
jgi:hypothetical protein